MMYNITYLVSLFINSSIYIVFAFLFMTNWYIIIFVCPLDTCANWCINNYLTLEIEGLANNIVLACWHAIKFYHTSIILEVWCKFWIIGKDILWHFVCEYFDKWCPIFWPSWQWPYGFVFWSFLGNLSWLWNNYVSLTWL